MDARITTGGGVTTATFDCLWQPDATERDNAKDRAKHLFSMGNLPAAEKRDIDFIIRDPARSRESIKKRVESDYRMLSVPGIRLYIIKGAETPSVRYPLAG
jgi:hypothetical protein